jgi:hypothetical protein
MGNKIEAVLFFKKATSYKLQANSKHNFHLVFIGEKPGAVRCSLRADRTYNK